MMNKAPAQTCEKCGIELTVAALGGLCPGCVAALAFGAVKESKPAVNRFALPDFEGYQVIEEIGRGGMGVVFKARQTKLNRLVAVKTILAGRLASEAEVQRLRAEAQAAAQLQHPNIVAIHEVGEHDGLPFFSMDYVEGQNLAQVVGDKPLEPERAARYVKMIAEAISYAHQQGILHRDLKPSNVLIDQFDQPRVTDFGLAKRLFSERQLQGQTSQLTATGQILGTPSFIPPEQAGGNRPALGPASDIYSLGAILYFLLTAQPPFTGGSLEEVLSHVLNTEPVPPRKLNPGVPRDLETICLKCLEKDSRQRYGAAQEMAEDLGRFLRNESILARPVNRAEKAWRWCRRYPAVSSLALSLALTLASIPIVLTVLQTRQYPSPARSGSSRLTRRSFQYEGPVPNLVAFDEDTLVQTAFGPGLGVAVDPRNNHLWCPIMSNSIVLIRDGANGRVLTNLVLADCPRSVALDDKTRIAWVVAQCGVGDTNFPSSDLLWAINADTYEIIREIPCGGVNGSPEVVNPVTGRFYHGCNPYDRHHGACQRVDTVSFVPSKPSFGTVRAVLPEAGLLYVTGASNILQILDGLPDPETVLTNVSLPFTVGTAYVAVNPRINRIYIGCMESNSIVIADARTGQFLDTITLDGGVAKVGSVRGLAVDPIRNRLFVIALSQKERSWYLFSITGSIQRAILLPGGAGGPVVNLALAKVYVWVTETQ